MKLLISIIAVLFLSAPLYAGDNSLNIHITAGTCFPEYVITVDLYPQTKEVVYKLYSFPQLTEKEKASLILRADIPLKLVDTNGCA